MADPVDYRRLAQVGRGFPDIEVTVSSQQVATHQRIFLFEPDTGTGYLALSEDQFASVVLERDGVERGRLYKVIKLRGNNGTFIAPPESDAEHFAIKKLRIDVVQQLLANGDRENPWAEIYFMQQLGDDCRVPRVTALCDDEYLYIITLWANGGTLWDIRTPVCVEDARNYANQMFEILKYIHEQNICHHDIKPMNFLLHNGRLLLIDFAMAFRMHGEEMVQDDSRYGTTAWMMPEHFLGKAYKPKQYDLWAVIVILYSLATGFPIMYRIPTDQCFLFEYLISARALSRNLDNNDLAHRLEMKWNDRVLVEKTVRDLAFSHWHMHGDTSSTELQQLMLQQVLLRQHNLNSLEQVQRDLALLHQRITSLSGELLEVFEKSLSPKPEERGSREMVSQLLWMRG